MQKNSEAECIVPASLACEVAGFLVSFSLKNVARKVRDKAAWKQNRGQKRKRWVKGRGWPPHCAELPAFFLFRPSPSNFDLFLGKNTNEKHTKRGLLSGYISTHIFDGVKYYQVLPVYCIPFTNRNQMRLSWFSDNIKLTINFPRAGLRTHDKKPKIERRRIEVQSLIRPDPRLNTVSVPNFFQSYLAFFNSVFFMTKSLHRSAQRPIFQIRFISFPNNKLAPLKRFMVDN